MFYNSTDIITNDEGQSFYKIKQFPVIELKDTDDYVITTIGDNLTALAYQYYNDPNLWKIIAIANNYSVNGSIFPTPGTQLRIPTDISDIISLFK